MPSRRLAQAAVDMARQAGHTAAGPSRFRYLRACPPMLREDRPGRSSRAVSRRGAAVDRCFFTPSPAPEPTPSSSPSTSASSPPPSLLRRLRRALRARRAPLALLAALPIEATGPAGGSGSEAVQAYTALTSYPPFTTIGELLLASPLPSYGLTIVLSTIALRSLITLPVSVWQRRRQERLATVVGPLVHAKSNEIAKEILAAHVKEGRKRTADNERVFTKELERRVSAYRQEMQRKHKVRPLLTSLGPMLANVPLLIVFSLSIRAALEAPGSPLALSPFLWIDHLGQADIALGIAGGMLTFLNSEVTRIRGEHSLAEITAAEEQMEANRRAKAESWKDARRAKREQQAMDIQQRADALLAQRTRRHARPSFDDPTGPAGPKRTITTSAVLAHSRPPARPSPPLAPLSTFPASPAEPQPVQEIRVYSPEATRVARLTKLFENLGKFSGVFIICLSTQVPSGLVLYWVSSISFTLAQNVYFTYFAKKPKHTFQAAKQAAADAIKQ